MPSQGTRLIAGMPTPATYRTLRRRWICWISASAPGTRRNWSMRISALTMCGHIFCRIVASA
jgi:hypothetical protein